MVIILYTLTYNNEKEISEFIDFYKQRIPNLYIVVHDLGSGDNTKKIVEEKEIKFIQGQYSNIIDFINNCWKNSVAELVILAQPDEYIQITNNNLSNCSILKGIGYDVRGDEKTRNLKYDKVCLFDPTVIKELNFDGEKYNPLGFIRYGEVRPDLYHKI